MKLIDLLMKTYTNSADHLFAGLRCTPGTFTLDRPSPLQTIQVMNRMRLPSNSAVPRYGAALLALSLLAGCTAPQEKRAGWEGGAIASSRQSEEIRETLYGQYREWKGTRYRSGGLSKKGVDCSGFVLLTYRDRFGVTLPRRTKEQAREGKKVSRKSLRPGDLVFFKTGFTARHVGMYVGQGTFLHVSSKKGVTMSSLDSGYWSRRYRLARRILPLS